MPRSHGLNFVETLLSKRPPLSDIISHPILSKCEECCQEIHKVIGKKPPVVTTEVLKNVSNAIADLMRKYGIKGVRESETQCPLACYYEKKINHPVSVKDNIIVVDERYSIMLSEPMQEFIRRFDLGEYPDLELTN